MIEATWLVINGEETSAPVSSRAAQGNAASELRLLFFAKVFLFREFTSPNDILISKLRALFALNYAEVMLGQSARFVLDFSVSNRAAVVMRRVGYMCTASIGLLTLTAVCLLFGARPTVCPVGQDAFEAL